MAKFNFSKYAQAQGELDGALEGISSGLDEAVELVDPSEARRSIRS